MLQDWWIDRSLREGQTSLLTTSTIVKRREIDYHSQKGWNDQEIIFLANMGVREYKSVWGENEPPNLSLYKVSQM